jgi:hypothetical protein
LYFFIFCAYGCLSAFIYMRLPFLIFINHSQRTNFHDAMGETIKNDIYIGLTHDDASLYTMTHTHTTYAYTYAGKQEIMAIPGLSKYTGMNLEGMRRFALGNPGRVNEQDDGGWTLLNAATRRPGSLSLVPWLVDEMGADVEGRDKYGQTSIYEATIHQVLSFYLERGADPTVQDNDGETALMHHSRGLRANLVARLLQDNRVLATIDVQMTDTGKGGRSAIGRSALHLACCSYGRGDGHDSKGRITELLLLNHANPLLRDSQGQTALDLLRQTGKNNPVSIARVERAMESQRIYSLAKARHVNDANHAIGKVKAKALKEARTRAETMSKLLAETPPYLKERVQGGQVALPRVVQPEGKSSEGEEQMVAVMKYVLRDESEYPEVGGMHEDVFVELLEMMAPKWDAIRGGGADVAAAAAAADAAAVAAAAAAAAAAASAAARARLPARLKGVKRKYVGHW